MRDKRYAYSLIDVKSIDEEKRIVEGLASSPKVDRVGDIVEPLGAKFQLPMPLLLDHNHKEQVGHVTFAQATKEGIPFRAQITRVTEPGAVKDLVDKAWHLVKYRLRSAVSIGFRGLDNGVELMKNGGLRFTAWEWLELSLVSVGAQDEAIIYGAKGLDDRCFHTIKSIDTGIRAALGIRDSATARPVPPGASGLNRNSDRQEAKMNISEKIAAMESQRTEKIKAWEGLQAFETKTDEQKALIKQHREEVESLDEELDDLKALEKTIARKATPITPAVPQAPGITLPATAKKKLEPGILFAQMAKVKINSKLDMVPPLIVAAKMYGQDSDVFGIIKAGEVLPGTAASGNWAYDLISQEGAAAADFVDWLRPQMITGRFGQNGVPAFTNIGFYEPYVTQTAGGTGGWVGEAKPKPATAFDFDRSTLTPLKMAAITVLSDRNIRYSSPQSDTVIRNELARMLIQLEDATFIDPTNSGTSNVKPASITNGVEAIASTGTDLEDVDLDIRSAMARFTAASNALSSGVWIMSPDNAIALSLMRNSLGVLAFGGIDKMGGMFMNLPVITSTAAGSYVILVNATDIYYADEGGVQVDASRETAIEMKDAANLAQDASAATGASLVSMFQNNMVALRAEKTVNWKRRRTVSVSYLSGVVWGGAVHIS